MLTKYSKDYLFEEISRFIKENKRYPTSEDMRIKYGYPPISAFTSTFGSWKSTLDAYENTLFPEQTIDVDLITKYSLICQNEIYQLWLKYPNISIEIISDIMQKGYDCGIAAEAEAVDLQFLKDMYL